MSDTTSAQLTLGKVLKALRVEKGLSLEDIHSKTRISIKKLEWIESDHFDEFEAPVFVRGYIRSYARVVGGDADNLVALYDEIIASSSTPDLGDSSSVDIDSGESEQSDARFRSFFNNTPIWAVVLVLVGVWLVAMLFSGSDSDQEALLADSAAVEPVLVGSELKNSEQVRGVAGEEKEMEEANSSVVDTKSPELAVKENREELESQPLIEQSAQSSPENSSETNDVADVDAVSEPGEGTSKAVSDYVNTQRRLDFIFSDDCWVEIKDASGSTIFADLKNKGDNLRLFGRAPLNIMLGNARAAILEVDGEPHDIKISGGRKTSRFNVYAAR